MAGGQQSASKLKAAERRQVVFALRKQGLSMRDILDHIKENHPGTPASLGTVKNDLSKVMQQLVQQTFEDAESVLAMELARLDDLLAAYWVAAVGTTKLVQNEDGSTAEVYIPPDHKTAELTLKIIDRRMKLLGLDKTNLQVSDAQGRPILLGGQYSGLDEGELDQVLLNLLAAAGLTSGQRGDGDG